MQHRTFDHLLEVGYGSGIFFPELAKRSEKITGLDIHLFSEQVKSRVEARRNTSVDLYSGIAEDMPFQAESFSAVIAVSSLEFIFNLKKTLQEITRVMKPNGSFFVITPVEPFITDLGFRILTGLDPKEGFKSRRAKIIPTLLTFFEVEKHQSGPFLRPFLPRLYDAFELRKEA